MTLKFKSGAERVLWEQVVIHGGVPYADNVVMAHRERTPDTQDLASGISPELNRVPLAFIRSWIASGKKIDAIREVREKTGWSLTDAADYVNRIETEDAARAVRGEPSTT